MRTLALYAALTLAGCSIVKTRSIETAGAQKCTTSVAPAAVDTGMLVMATGGATYAAFETDGYDHVAIPAAIGAGVIFTISALVGYTRATRCKRARIREGIAY